MPALVHPTASVESRSIGGGSSVGAYSRIGAEVEIGERVRVGERVSIEGRVHISAGVEIAPDAYLRGPLTVGADVRIGPRCCMDADGDASGIVLCEGSIAGAQSTIWPGVTVGRRARIEPGSVVTKNVPAVAVVAGNPAQIVRYSGARPATRNAQSFGGAAAAATEVPGVTLHELPLHEDLRGNLTFGEARRHVPFEIKRYFLTFSVVSEEVRGEHAHRRLEQFLVCINGRVRVAADDGRVQADFLLERPNLGLYIPPMIWSVQYRFSADAVLLGLCSDLYDPADYIRDYAEFLQLARR